MEGVRCGGCVDSVGCEVWSGRTWMARQSILPSERVLRKVIITSSEPGLYVSNTRNAIRAPWG